ncbi:MAG: rhamnulokinase [Actinomycetales bacterium]|nr:rhamnulokinase [Actinomycetales bacterium]
MTGHVAAIDLGATSGRVIIGTVGANELSIDPVARFLNTPVHAADGMHWDIHGLFASVIEGLQAAFAKEPTIASIGVDSWGCDYGLVRGTELLGIPFHYRDERTSFGVSQVHAKTPHAELFTRNGLQFLPFNTVYQLAAERQGSILAHADSILLIPDLINFWLTGRRFAERSNASTTGLLNVRTGQWDLALAADDLVAPSQLPPLIDAGTVIGSLSPDMSRTIGGAGLPSGFVAEAATRAVNVGSVNLGAVNVVAIGSHDTASAVAAIPMDPTTSAYISCGTWGLVGVEIEKPCLTEEALAANFTNEGGVDGRIRFLHNVMGLWLLSESVRQWERDGATINLVDLLAAAEAITVPVPVFDANDGGFLHPGDMPSRIAEWFTARGRIAPQSHAEFARSIIESLAEAFAQTVRRASELSGVPVRTIHMVGGGSQNALLCQRAADRSGLPVLAGPVEATAIGNVLIQARTQGFITGDLETLRGLVLTAFPPISYLPSTQGH